MRLLSKIYTKKILSLFMVLTSFTAVSLSCNADEVANASKADKAKNVIFILTDDQRYDEVGFLNANIHTPNIDKLAQEGVHFKNAFVTTSLCSPSRATILTGQYMHNHGVVDNNRAAKKGLRYFPQYLQQAGYSTAFFGKWHMGGHGDDKQPGFDHWVSFAGQGEYYPSITNGKTNTLNVNGEDVPQKGYITDELTDYALDWLEQQKGPQLIDTQQNDNVTVDQQDKKKPFFAYLSHKAVHAMFKPAPRHEEQYTDVVIPMPSSQLDNSDNYQDKPMWVKNQRNSWHGVDFPYHSALDIQEYKRQYHRTLSAVDDSVGRLLNWLKENDLAEDTVVILMGDNGFMFGEHGLIDKRNAYEESMRVPMFAYAPGHFPSGKVVTQMVANLDIAPTILALAGVAPPKQFEGQSMLPLVMKDNVDDWRDSFLYEYYWEFNYPSTPTTFALRTDKFKYIQYHGVWDLEELYDIENDPKEMHNLIYQPEHFSRVVEMRNKLFQQLANNQGQRSVPFNRKFNHGAVFRESARSRAAEYPDTWLRKGTDKDLTNFFYPDEMRLNTDKNKLAPAGH